MSENLIRVGGRIAKCHLPFENRHQIILSQNHHLSKLLIQHYHETNCHCGRNQTLALLQESVWIVNGKTLTRKVLNNCSYCKKQYTKPSQPLMGDLPKQRLDIATPAFTNTMIDYFGPMIVKLYKGTRATKATSKHYGAIFTCLSTRATHIELVGDLTTDKFILALRRFIFRRGYPNHVNSDNGTNFTGADRELATALKNLDQKKIINELIAKRIEWTFSPPLTPWMNGAVESIVKMTKRALRAITKERNFKEESLHTYLIEVESILNSRPLTSLSDDIEDLEPLTPNHFIIGKASPNVRFNLTHDTEINLRKQWRSVQAATSMFWRRWIREYLPLITTRSKWRTSTRNFQPGDLVLISEKDIARSNWLLARVLQVYKSDDNIVRVVQLKTKNGIYTRPAAKLCLLEACD